MRYRVTLKSGDVHEFNSPFHIDSLRKSMNLPLTAKIEMIDQPTKEHEDERQENPAA